ncbi:alpha/beta hydrolase [Maribacter stanieri]|uniref:Phospholipase/Carboxylesterase n=1 Tax=Maribacter stanieri TaxID=440514 RepID=A0A1I6JT91_9FLAO|nr:esterase [Maribacter stanieri]SFR82131.1 Phospholipase/Carboxylesterase [Maribacter stanieri]
MENQIKNVTYKTTNTYETLNEINSNTKRVWLVFHGIGFLSRFFLKYFNELPKEENYILAPQAPSKYYLKNEYKHVGASWLTKENTAIETENLFNYLDAVLENENLPTDCEIIVFGFSQGVSIALRYLAYSKLQCSKIIIYAGGIPKELNKTDFSYFENKTEIVSIIGDHDEYLTPKRLEEENRKLNSLFGVNIRHINFKGAHEVKKEIINQLAI